MAQKVEKDRMDAKVDKMTSKWESRQDKGNEVKEGIPKTEESFVPLLAVVPLQSVPCIMRMFCGHVGIINESLSHSPYRKPIFRTFYLKYLSDFKNSIQMFNFETFEILE